MWDKPLIITYFLLYRPLHISQWLETLSFFYFIIYCTHHNIGMSVLQKFIFCLSLKITFVQTWNSMYVINTELCYIILYLGIYMNKYCIILGYNYVDVQQNIYILTWILEGFFYQVGCRV